MKLALLFSGTFRNSTQLTVDLLKWFRSQENVTEVDVYMHFWWQKEYVGQRQTIESNQLVEDDPTDNIITNIHPTKLVIEKQEAIDFTNLPKKCAAGGTAIQRERAYFTLLSQMKSFKRCFDLIDNIYNYDIIIRIRPDLYLTDMSYKLNINELNQNKHIMWIADGRFFTGWPLGDWTFLSSPENMKLFAENWECIFRQICISRGSLQHIHEYLPILFNTMSISIEPWYIPLKISRTQVLVDNSSDMTIKPYFFDMIPPDRFID